jgi:pimeloyl-ACP methyl ester carboxylesterase
MAPVRKSDLRGVVHIATDATVGLVNLVEALHERIARVPLLHAGRPPGKTTGVTGLVYKSIRGVTHVVGGSVQSLLGVLDPILAPEYSVPERDALIAALNGVLGDYLATTGNPLATPMSLCHQGRPLLLEPSSLASTLPEAGDTVLVLLHGLCMNDLQWTRHGRNVGMKLGHALGCTPLFLRYNSGQHISTNGQGLARLLDHMVLQWPQPVKRIVLLGHSMGGLVARSAFYYAQENQQYWPSLVSDLLFLGSPHHGAPLERAGNWIDTVLDATPYATPFARLGKVRSAGITDLRYGNLVDEDWVGVNRFSRRADPRQPVPLPVGLRCFTLASTIGEDNHDVKGQVLGDGLVPLASALGQHKDPERCLRFAEDHQWVGHGINHLDLLSHPQVQDQLLRWLTAR